MKIRKMFDPVERRQISCGEHTKPKYEWVFDKDTGSKVLKAVGKIDFFQKIQDATVGVTLAEYIQRYERLKDPEILEGLKDSKPIALDLRGMPTDILDYQEKMQAVAGIFDKLPARYKEIYNSDRDSFVRAIWSGDLSIFGEEKKVEVSENADA